MRRRWTRRSYGWIGVGFVVVLASITVVPRALFGLLSRPGQTIPENLVTVPVKRTDLHVRVTASGLVESSNRTVIECELETIDAGVNGQRTTSGGSSTILSVVPEGTMVKSGDVLCELDASAYEEVLRQQEMTVERAKADHNQAELDAQVARLALTEFRNGLHLQTLKEMQGQIALAESESEHARDRLAWSRRMFAKGYASGAQVSSDAVAEMKSATMLRQGRVNLDVYQRYNAPLTIRALENDITAAEALLNYQTARLNKHQGRLRRLRHQIELCTIRAPHDGFVIYASDPYHRIIIEPGMTVRQLQKLFYLPDLAQMQVGALLHESVVDQVHDGMRAKVTIEGLPDRVVEGRVVSVDMLPTRNWFSEVPYYMGMVKLDDVPRGIRPGMSAEVEIATTRLNDVLSIPSQALAVEEGQEVCYVAGPDGLERREVKVGRATQNQLEVSEGLAEGEEVVLEPGRFALAGVADSNDVDSPAGESPEPSSAANAE